MTAPLLDHLAEPLPEGFEDIVRVVYRAANAKKDGTPRKRERASLARCRAWILGEDQLTDREQMLLAVARRNARMGTAFRRVQRDIFAKDSPYPTPAWITADPISWHAPTSLWKENDR